MERLFTFIGVIAVVCGAVALEAIFYAFSLQILWGWFVVPLGAPPIGYAHAWGLSILASLFMYNANAARNDDSLWHVLAMSLLMNVGLLACGALAHYLMTT
jgi:hypothetical protein